MAAVAESAVLLDKFGAQSMYEIIMDRRLLRLGHAGRVSDGGLPGIVLFS